MLKLRYSKEDFGYLVVFPDGTIHLYSDDVAPLLDTTTELDDLKPMLLKQIPVGPNFHLKSPLIVWLEATRKCNLQCSHCYIDAGRPRKNEMSFDEITTALDDLKALGTHSVVFAGGEPYLRKDFPDILEYAASLDFILAVVTNGSYITREVLARFPKENCRLTLSVDGIKAHNTIRGGQSTFELMEEKLSLMKEMGIPHSVSTLISKANIHELPELLDWCIERDIVFRTVAFNPIGRGILNTEVHNLDKSDAAASAAVFWMQKVFESKKNKDIGPCVSKFFEYALNLMYMTRREHCSRSIAYIAADGEVYPCVSSAATQTFGAGNIRNTKFSTLWKQSFKEMRSITWDHFIKEDCHGCSYNQNDYFCANRCPVMSLVLNGKLIGCGATEFSREDLRLRTERLRAGTAHVC
ncbi:MAG: radical SAM protein [Rhodospirillales bacterium]|nr:radical SAM protein [Rhodospirillales bacterium]